jgi:hypothetical protein
MVGRGLFRAGKETKMKRVTGESISATVEGVMEIEEAGEWKEVPEPCCKKAAIKIFNAAFLDHGRAYGRTLAPPSLVLDFSDHEDDGGYVRISKFMCIELGSEELHALIRFCLGALESIEEAREQSWIQRISEVRGESEAHEHDVEELLRANAELRSELDQLRVALAEDLKKKGKRKK